MSLKLLRGASLLGGQLQSMRRMSRAFCEPYPGPRCNPIHLSKMRCDVERIKEVMNSDYMKKGCCPIPCPEMPRFDEMYYKPSDKLNRIYKQTWVEPAELRRMPVPVCCNLPSGQPPIERRPRKPRKDFVKCKVSSKNWGLLPCPWPPKCPRIRLEHCLPCRVPPTCKIVRRKTICQKLCVPYPSYSECVRRDLAPPPHAAECRCLYIIPFCPADTILHAMPS